MAKREKEDGDAVAASSHFKVNGHALCSDEQTQSGLGCLLEKRIGAFVWKFGQPGGFHPSR